jgi:hypothetical protein
LPYSDDFDSPVSRIDRLLDLSGLRSTGAMAIVLIEDGMITHKRYSLSSFSCRTGELDDTVAEGPRLDPY